MSEIECILYLQTYQHCFQAGTDAVRRTTPYQILNSTGVSSITWGGHNGMYIMVVTVVARDYRYTQAIDNLSSVPHSHINRLQISYKVQS